MTTHGAARTRMIAVLLLLRGTIHGAFAAWVIIRQPGWSAIFEIGARCGIADGSLGILTAAIYATSATRDAPRLIGSITFADALGRLLLGITLPRFPGATSFPVAVMSLFGAIAASGAVLGIIGFVAWLVARVRGGRTWTLDTDALFDPLAVAALIAFVVAIILFVNPPATAEALRRLASSVTLALAIVFVFAAGGALAHRLEPR